ncbi:hypothetical protein TNCV_2349881 [Trichonephila clavipes]|uniref:Uncharacterized protein n=1 Tax=Trichonephila clavipes TaxID=2585209 RepID=A0A8X6VPL4_TRICX|nr:hypothetical protein TNCV_2349881 [Trichonephila clavipes]
MQLYPGSREGHIVPTDGLQRLYYSERNNEAMLPLRNEFTRLSIVNLTTIDPTTINKMNGWDMVLFSFNCQSLRAHEHDLRGNIVQKVAQSLKERGEEKRRQGGKKSTRWRSERTWRIWQNERDSNYVGED